MDKIKIKDMSILGDIAKQLRIPLTQILDGITQEQAEAVESLTIREDNTEVLSNFSNLKKLRILGKESSKELSDITISDLPKLESLEILGTKKTRTINLRNLPNTYYVNISGNKNLQEIVGLEDLEGLMNLYATDNKSLSKLFDLKRIAENPDIDKIKLDISTLHLLSEQYSDLSEIANNSNMKRSIQWLERVDGQWFKLDYSEGIEIESKANKILGEVIDDSMSDLEKICAINTWLTENVKYDIGASDARDEVLDGNYDMSRIGMLMNAKANTSYNSLVGQTAVCEGYTNGMKYLLNRVGIEAETVPCKIWNSKEQRTDFVNRNEANHSIIRFKTKDGWFYSDPTWESEQPDRRKYFFKTKDEMSKIHGLTETEITVESPEIRPQKYSNEILSEILTNQRDGVKKSKQPIQQEEYKEQVETKTRTDSNPESFRSGMKFDIPLEMHQEILERHNAAERNFAREMAESPDKKKSEQVEYGVK